MDNHTNEQSLDELVAMAGRIMNDRMPDLIIPDEHGRIYLKRWFVIPRNTLSNVYLHWFEADDSDRALHDHPWSSRSIVLTGAYREFTPNGDQIRRAGDVVERKATDLHRICLIDGQPCLTLFMTGAVERDWGFQCDDGWIHWADFLERPSPDAPIPGCGEDVPRSLTGTRMHISKGQS